MIHLFLNDIAMWDFSDLGLTTNANMNQGAGYLTDNMDNYFVTSSSIKDERSSRLTVLDTPSEKPVGTLSLHFDTANTTEDLSTYDAADYVKLFNIIEKCVYDTNVNDTVMNTILLGDNAYGGYIEDSIIRSASQTTIDVTGESIQQSNTVKDLISFSFDNGATVIDFRIYVAEDNFNSGYPISTITKVISPCDPNKFISMSSYANVLTAISESASYVNNELNSPVADQDHSGVYNLSVGFFNEGTTPDYDMSFALLFKGRTPTEIEAKVATREYLIATSVTTEETWKTLFPSLWSTNAFYLIPMWDNKTPEPGSIYTNMISHLELKTVAVDKLIDHTELIIDMNMSVFKNSAIEIPVISVPDMTNDVSDNILSDVHTTYLSIDATSPNWNLQTEATRAFNEHLSNVLGVCLGGTNTWGYATVVKVGREWYQFNDGSRSIYVLTPTGYGV